MPLTVFVRVADGVNTLANDLAAVNDEVHRLRTTITSDPSWELVDSTAQGNTIDVSDRRP